MGRRGLLMGAWNAGFVFTCMRGIYQIGTFSDGTMDIIFKATIFATIVGLIWLKGHEIIARMGE